MKLFVKDKDFYKSFFSLTGMIALQNVITFSVNLADNLMLGAYSEEAMSGAALVNQIQFLLQMLILGVGEGLVVLASQYWGKGEIKPIKRLTSCALGVGLGASLLLFGAVFCAPRFCLSLFTNQQAYVEQAVKYMNIICFSYPIFAVTNVLLASLRSVETVKIGYLVSLSTLVINCTLNYFLIFGNFGAPEMGAQGAATATLIARIVELGIVLGFLFFREKKLRFAFKEFFISSRALFKDYIASGLPIILSNASWGIAMAIQTAILGHMEGALPANSIASTVYQIVSVLAYGASSVACIITGKTIGSGRSGLIKDYARTMQIIFLIIGLFTGLALFCLRGPILSLYKISEATRALAGSFLMVLSVTVIGTSYQVAVLTGIVRGGGDTRFVFFNDLIFMWLIVLPASAAAAFWLELSPVWVFICLKADQVLKCAVAFVKVNFGKYIHKLTR
jgi:MATE efflux family protein